MKSIAFVVFVALTIFAGHVAAAPMLEYAEAKALADKDKASLAPEASASLRNSQSALLQAGAAACATPTPDLSPFVVVMELDAQGMVVRTWLQGSSPIGVCMRKYVSGKALTVPPRTPFYTSLELSFSK
jgi:hypothetical protein